MHTDENGMNMMEFSNNSFSIHSFSSLLLLLLRMQYNDFSTSKSIHKCNMYSINNLGDTICVEGLCLLHRSQLHLTINLQLHPFDYAGIHMHKYYVQFYHVWPASETVIFSVHLLQLNLTKGESVISIQRYWNQMCFCYENMLVLDITTG